MKSGGETLEGLVKNKTQMKRWSEASKRGIWEQKIIVVGKSAFLICKWEEAEKGEKIYADVSPSTPSPQLPLKIS